MLAEHVGDREHDIRGGHARRDRAGELEAHDSRDEHGDRLTEHGGLGLDAAHSPTEHAETVDHGGVRVGTDARVGVGAEHTADLTVVHDLREVLDVHLVHDAGAGGNDLEVVEGGLAPPQELVTLAVALVLDLDIALECVGRSEEVSDHRVVDHHLGGRKRVDLGGIPTEVGHGLAHRREIDDAGNTGEVLHHDACRGELDLGVGLGVRVPRTERLDLLLGDVRTVLGAKQVLQQHLQAEGKLLVAGDGVDPEDFVVGLPDCQCALGTEAVNGGHVCSFVGGGGKPVAPHLVRQLRTLPARRALLGLKPKSILTSR